MRIDLINYINNANQFVPGETIVLAISGGVDSMVLFDVLRNSKFNLNIILAHVNHKQRLDSEKEFKEIKKLAHDLQYPFEGYVMIETENTNFHDNARKQRYDFFQSVAQKHNANKIILAHHIDDQIETILMRLTRGSSFSGYAGISATRVENGKQILRPFINISKNDILSYAEKHNVVYYEDASNSEDHYTRNRFRHAIIPQLRLENPNLDEKIIQFKDYIDSAETVLERIKDDFLKSQTSFEKISIADFNNLDRIIKIKILTELVNQATNNTLEISYRQYNIMIDACLNSIPNQQIKLGKTYEFIKEYQYFKIKKQTQHKKQSLQIDDCGEYILQEKYRFIISNKKLEHIDTNYFELCYNDKVFPLYLRNRINGDRIKLSIGTKKVKDIFIDKKVPLLQRDKIVLLSDKEHVLWIPGIKKSIQNKDCPNKLYVYEVK